MKKVFKLILLFLWMILIFYLSGQPADLSNEVSDYSTGLIARFLSAVFYRTDTEMIVSFLSEHVLYVRKTAHIFEYLVLGVLVCANSKEFFRSKTLFVSVLFCFLFAISDEIHQLFISGRSGSAIDVLIDGISSFFGILLYHRFMKNEKETHNSADSSDRLPQ